MREGRWEDGQKAAQRPTSRFQTLACKPGNGWMKTDAEKNGWIANRCCLGAHSWRDGWEDKPTERGRENRCTSQRMNVLKALEAQP